MQVYWEMTGFFYVCVCVVTQHPVYCVNVVGTQNANNLITVSTDGRMCSWSLDMLSQPQVCARTSVLSQDRLTSVCVCVGDHGAGVQQIQAGGGDVHGVSHGGREQLRGGQRGGRRLHGVPARQVGPRPPQLRLPELRAPDDTHRHTRVCVCTPSKAGIFGMFEGHQGPATGVSCHGAVGAVDFSHLFITSSFDWTIKLWSTKVV